MVQKILNSFILILLIWITVSCDKLIEESDKSDLNRIFKIPDDAEMIAYDGFPAMVGFGQREGLTISANYSLNKKSTKNWIQNVKSLGLKKLPIPEECKSKIWIKDKLIPLDLQSGYYFCRTAGNDVLNAKETKSCDEVESMNDIILAILDPEKMELSVIVASGY